MGAPSKLDARARLRDLEHEQIEWLCASTMAEVAGSPEDLALTAELARLLDCFRRAGCDVDAARELYARRMPR